MADSSITKNALANAMKELMEEKDFSKISVSDICERCSMNRKSFYYHFKDKYDLVNWIFDVEFSQIVDPQSQVEAWHFLDRICLYLYENKKFYRHALQIHGQNSFEDHFIECMIPVIKVYIKEILGDEKIDDFYVNFCIDAFVGTIKRWILNKKDMPPEEFLMLLSSCISILGQTKESVKKSDTSSDLPNVFS